MPRKPGSRKSKSDHSSSTLFWMGVPVRISRWLQFSCFTALEIWKQRKLQARLQGLSQDSEIGCPKLASVKLSDVLFLKVDHNLLRLQFFSKNWKQIAHQCKVLPQRTWKEVVRTERIAINRGMYYEIGIYTLVI